MSGRGGVAVAVVVGALLLAPAASGADPSGDAAGEGRAVIELTAVVPDSALPSPDPAESPTPSAEPSQPTEPASPAPGPPPERAGTSPLAATGGSPWMVGVAVALAAILVGVAARASRRGQSRTSPRS